MGAIYTIKENFKNSYRIIQLAKYEIMASNRDVKLGWLWNVISPLIQVGTYWFVFGIGIRNGEPVGEINFINWMLAGVVVWFFLSACIRKGCNAIYAKRTIITKMIFPISILPTTVVLKELFYHVIMLGIAIVIMLFNGFRFSIYNLNLIYYIFAAVMFAISVSMLLSVLSLKSRDVKRMVDALMRMLFYITPILWTMDTLPNSIQLIMKCNPIYYIANGYRISLFTTNNIFNDMKSMIVFWIITLTCFLLGSKLLYKYRHRFVDFI